MNSSIRGRAAGAAVAVVSLMATTMAATIAAPVAAAQSVTPGSVGGAWDAVRGVADAPGAGDDESFYTAPEGVDLGAVPPGTVLRERSLAYHLAGLETPVRVDQILHTTVDAMGTPIANVTTVVQPPGPADGNTIAYQSFYDSLNKIDNPSRIIAGGRSVGGLIPTIESGLITPALLAGHRVVIADTEGPEPQFAAGPAYGVATLDSLRAASHSTTAGVGDTGRIALMGYSGGAIASNWAAIELEKYAPELASRVVGVAQGGVFVDPIHNLDYAGEGVLWAGVAAMALIGIAHSYHVDLDPYLNDYGKQVLHDSEHLSIIESLARYPKVRWEELARPEYPTPADVPGFAEVIDSLDMGRGPVPHVPMLVTQGANGVIGLTPTHPEFGVGDGVMVTGDVRALASKYCAAGTPVLYREYPFFGHLGGGLAWLPEAIGWVEDRLHGAPAPQNCAEIPAGNDIG